MEYYFIKCIIKNETLFIKSCLHDEDYLFFIDELLDMQYALYKIIEEEYESKNIYLQLNYLIGGERVIDIEGETELAYFLESLTIKQ